MHSDIESFIGDSDDDLEDFIGDEEPLGHSGKSLSDTDELEDFIGDSDDELEDFIGDDDEEADLRSWLRSIFDERGRDEHPLIDFLWTKEAIKICTAMDPEQLMTEEQIEDLVSEADPYERGEVEFEAFVAVVLKLKARLALKRKTCLARRLALLQIQKQMAQVAACLAQTL